MNWEYFKKSVGHRVQLEPPACRLDRDGSELPLVNDDWIVEEVKETGIRISNIRTGDSVLLGSDHIHHFATNPARSRGNVKFGFLVLTVQVFVGQGAPFVRPAARPGERVEPLENRPVEKWVDLRYPWDAGIQQRLEAEGYRVAWCLESKLARKIDLEGWEIVIEADARGVPAMFRMKDRPENQTLIKTRTGAVGQAQPPRSVKRCLDCGQDLYLERSGLTTADAVWLCSNRACPSNARVGR